MLREAKMFTFSYPFVMICLVADLGVISSVLQPTFVVREHIESFQTVLGFQHTYGRPIPAVNGSDSNLNFTGFVSEKDCSMNATDCGYGHTPAEFNLQDTQMGSFISNSHDFSFILHEPLNCVIHVDHSSK